jgi:hypothetical protein
MSQGNLAIAEELYTDGEYIEFERQADEKHELSNGEIITIAGARSLLPVLPAVS